MARKAGGSGKDEKKGLGLEDFQLWKDFTRDIEPLEDVEWEEIEAEIKNAPPSKSQKSDVETIVQKVVLPEPQVMRHDQAPQLDARTESRLKRGRMPIEGRLDLHGRNQEQAHMQLNEFVTRAHNNGKRCLLVITGKGRGGLMAKDWYSPDREDGVLKQKLPLWVSMYPLRDIVLKVMQASPKDGGGGAFYLYLKRQRD